MNDQDITLEEIFHQDGLIAKAFPGYQIRDAQVQMADAVSSAIANNQQLVVEAGTGTGKTFAYLIPALRSGKKVIISTGTKTLQDQLFFRDLPVVMKIINSTVKKALLKGRANYLCLHRMEQACEEGRLSNKKQAAELQAVKKWSTSTRYGDLSDCPSIQEQSPVIPLVTSTRENCLGMECEQYENCFLMKARRRAHKSDIVVINHHLFFAAQAVKGKGDNDLLPEVDAVIFDEAHQIPEIATQFLGEYFSSRQLSLFATDCKLVVGKDAPDCLDLHDHLQKIMGASAEIFVAFGQVNRNTYAHIRHKPELKNAMQELALELDAVIKLFEPLAVRSKELENCWQRAQELKDSFIRLTSQTPPNQVHWYELSTQNFRLHLTPISIKERMQEIMGEEEKSWIFTSATIATSTGNFSLFINELGMKSHKALKLDSPFNFKEQTLLYLPPNMPEPKSPDFVRALIAAAIPVLKASRGRAFLLFTSYRAMNEAYELMSQHTGYRLFLQGNTSKAELLRQFVETDNAVLLGTSSFWEGVDVRGDDLSLVVIDKLPFSVPDEPITKAKVDDMRKRGVDPFTDYQVPQAVLALKQGAGRLIRDVKDKGVLMLCDPRLTTQHYGKVFLDSLPPMPITRQIEDVKVFFEKISQDEAMCDG